MKYLIIISILIISCQEKQEEYDALTSRLIEVVETQQTKIDSLEFELENCKANYDALDEATN